MISIMSCWCLQELKKLGPWKSQLEVQKKQIAEVQATLDDERRRADKFELQFKNLLERNEALMLEKEVSENSDKVNTLVRNAHYLLGP